MDSIKVFAPATVANVACGFDIMGFALTDIGDELIVKKTRKPGLQIEAIHGATGLPLDPRQNVTTVAAQALLNEMDTTPEFGFSFELTKKVSAGSGLGSSASSASAGVFAINELLGNPYSRKELVAFAMEGERAASGLPHADNVAPSLLGGFTLVRSYEPLDVINLEHPELFVTVVHPQIEIKTSDSKRILRRHITLQDAITQWGNVGGLVAGLAKGDYALISRSLKDVVAEPIRSMLIPLFREAKAVAMDSGALGCSISGSGPSIFTLSEDEQTARKICQAFNDLYNDSDIDVLTYVSSINPKGAEVIG